MATSLIIITSRNMCCYGAYGLPNTLTGLRNVLLLLASYPTTALPGRDHLLPIEICIPFLNLRYAPPPSLLVFQKCAARPRPPARVSDIVPQAQLARRFPPSLPPSPPSQGHGSQADRTWAQARARSLRRRRRRDFSNHFPCIHLRRRPPASSSPPFLHQRAGGGSDII